MRRVTFRVHRHRILTNQPVQHVYIMHTAVQEYPSYKHTDTGLYHVHSSPGISLLQTHRHAGLYHVHSCPGISLLQTHRHRSVSCTQLSRNIPPADTQTQVYIMHPAVQEYPSYKHTDTGLYHAHSCPGIPLLQTHRHTGLYHAHSCPGISLLQTCRPRSISCTQLSRNTPPTNTQAQVYITHPAVQEYPCYKHIDTGLYHAHSCPGISLLQTHRHAGLYHVHSCPGISLLQTHRHRSVSCTQLSRNIPPADTQTQVYIMFPAVQEYPSYEHTDTGLYHAPSCPGISLLQTHRRTGPYHAHSCQGISLLQTHRHRSTSCTQLSRNIPPMNTQTQVYIMHPAVQEYPSYKHTGTGLHHAPSCPGIPLLQTHRHRSISCTQLSRNIPPTNTQTQVYIMHTAVQEYPSYKHTDTGLYHAHSCPGIPLLQTHRRTGPYHAHSCPGISLLQTHRHRSTSCTQLSRNIPPTNTQTQVYIMHPAVQEYPSYKHTGTGLHHAPSCPGIPLLQTHRHRSISCTQLSRNIPPTNTQTQVYIMHPAVQEYPSYKHTDTGLYHAPSCPGIPLLQTHRHRSISCTQLSRNIPPKNTNNCTTRIHSSRMRTARSLTVSRSIRSGAVCQHPPGCILPPSPDADHPPCEQNDRCKNITFANFVMNTVIAIHSPCH